MTAINAIRDSASPCLRADRKGGSSDDRSVRGDHAKGHERNKKSTLLSALVGLSGLEPPTPTLSGWCSNLLSYNPSCGGDTRIRLIASDYACISKRASARTCPRLHRLDALRPQRNAGIFTCGGDTRIRTEDLLNANQALYQLSYIPT